MSRPGKTGGALRWMFLFLLRNLLPRALGGLLIGVAIGLVPELLTGSHGLFVRWILPTIGAAAGLTAGVALFLAAAAERMAGELTGAIVARMPADALGGVLRAPGRFLDRRVRGMLSGPVRALRVTAGVLIGLAAALSALTILLFP